MSLKIIVYLFTKKISFNYLYLVKIVYEFNLMVIHYTNINFIQL